MIILIIIIIVIDLEDYQLINQIIQFLQLCFLLLLNKNGYQWIAIWMWKLHFWILLVIALCLVQTQLQLQFQYQKMHEYIIYLCIVLIVTLVYTLFCLHVVENIKKNKKGTYGKLRFQLFVQYKQCLLGFLRKLFPKALILRVGQVYRYFTFILVFWVLYLIQFFGGTSELLVANIDLVRSLISCSDLFTRLPHVQFISQWELKYIFLSLNNFKDYL
eukprot:TRINITY_DN7196_c1_g1_i3.p4 TRINITY_DN7196_c1_g1~~TRINITY_DN7196_c1_g1_i3.p4  ORF type:complete len:217 (+),score=-18.68 TRINITY_DN7196_c1_g1_i3:820-1470(+)